MGTKGAREEPGRVSAKDGFVAEEKYGCKTWLPDFVPQWVRFVICFAWFLACVLLVLVASIFFLPRLRWRARLVKIFITIFGPIVSMTYGVRFHVSGTKNRGSLSERRSVIYIANHSSTLDFITCSRTLSAGTIAIAKRALLLHPLGWIAWLNGTVFIDRTNREKAIESMNAVGTLLNTEGVSVCIFPEGTRSRDGRLQAFKKGAMHLAMQTKVPIVPVVVNGAHRIWGKTGYRIECNADPIRITLLDPIDTRKWTPETLGAETEKLHELFISHLDEDSKPLKKA